MKNLRCFTENLSKWKKNRIVGAGLIYGLQVSHYVFVNNACRYYLEYLDFGLRSSEGSGKEIH